MQYRVTAVIDAVNLAPLIEALVPLSGKPLQVSACTGEKPERAITRTPPASLDDLLGPAPAHANYDPPPAPAPRPLPRQQGASALPTPRAPSRSLSRACLQQGKPPRGSSARRLHPPAIPEAPTRTRSGRCSSTARLSSFLTRRSAQSASRASTANTSQLFSSLPAYPGG